MGSSPPNFRGENSNKKRIAWIQWAMNAMKSWQDYQDIWIPHLGMDKN